MYLSDFKGFIRLHEICPTPEEPLVGPRALSAYSRSKMGGLVCSEAGAEISFCSVAVINKAF